MPDDQKLDLQIDSALSSYAEPTDGLEDRVLARLADTRTNAVPRKRWLARIPILPVALPLAACVLLFVVFSLRPGRKQPIQQAHNDTTSQIPTARKPVPPQPSQPREHSPQPHLVAAHAIHPATPKSAQPPKLDIFPTPRPLSPQERALVRFVANTPPSELQAMQKAQQEPQEQVEPLRIAAIVIQPIKPLDESDKEK